jgi:hypothetical protein
MVDGNYGVDVARFEYFFDHGDGRKDHGFAAAAMNILGRDDDGAETHRAQESDLLHIEQQKLAAAGNDIHLQVNLRRAFNIHAPVQDNLGNPAI